MGIMQNRCGGVSIGRAFRKIGGCHMETMTGAGTWRTDGIWRIIGGIVIIAILIIVVRRVVLLSCSRSS